MTTPSPVLLSTPLFVSSRLPLPSIRTPVPLPSVPSVLVTTLELPVIQKPIALSKARTFAIVWLEPSILYPATALPVAWISFVRPPFAPDVMVTTGEPTVAAFSVILQPMS